MTSGGACRTSSMSSTFGPRHRPSAARAAVDLDERPHLEARARPEDPTQVTSFSILSTATTLRSRPPTRSTSPTTWSRPRRACCSRRILARASSSRPVDRPGCDHGEDWHYDFATGTHRVAARSTSRPTKARPTWTPRRPATSAPGSRAASSMLRRSSGPARSWSTSRPARCGPRSTRRRAATSHTSVTAASWPPADPRRVASVRRARRWVSRSSRRPPRRPRGGAARVRSRRDGRRARASRRPRRAAPAPTAPTRARANRSADGRAA